MQMFHELIPYGVLGSSCLYIKQLVKQKSWIFLWIFSVSKAEIFVRVNVHFHCRDVSRNTFSLFITRFHDIFSRRWKFWFLEQFICCNISNHKINNEYKWNHDSIYEMAVLGSLKGSVWAMYSVSKHGNDGRIPILSRNKANLSELI